MKTRRNGDDHTAEMDLGGVVTKTDSRPWYRSALAERVSPRYRKTRAAAFVVFGLGKAVRKGTTTVAVAGGLAAKGKVQAKREERRRRREDPEWQYARRTGGAVFLCMACRTKFPSARQLNDHFVIEHLDEEPLAKSKPVKRNPASHKTYAKPPMGGRTKTGKRTPGRAQILESTYGAPARAIGVRGMETSTAARMVRAAGRQMADSSPQSLTELREQVLGMERALAVLGEGFEDYARTLRSDHGKREALASEVVNPHFGKAVQGLTEAQVALSAFIFNFEDIYGPAIRAAARGGHGGTKFIAS